MRIFNLIINFIKSYLNISFAAMVQHNLRIEKKRLHQHITFDLMLILRIMNGCKINYADFNLL